MSARRLLVAAALLAATGVPARADNESGIATSLSSPMIARPAAMGEAYAAVAAGADALFWNPAAIGDGPASVQLSRQSLYDLATMDAASIAVPFRSMGAAVGYTMLRHDAIAGLDASGFGSVSFRPEERTLAAGLSKRWGPWGIGAAGKTFRQEIGSYDDSSTSADIGVTAPGFWRNVRHAIVYSNLGGSLKLGTEEEKLPGVGRFGTSVGALKGLLLAADLVKPRDGDVYVACGLEWRAPTGSSAGLALRAGYNNRTGGQDGVAGFSGGVGLVFRGIGIDYAFSPRDDLGDQHLFTLGYAFAASPGPVRQSVPAAPASNAKAASERLHLK